MLDRCQMRNVLYDHLIQGCNETCVDLVLQKSGGQDVDDAGLLVCCKDRVTPHLVDIVYLGKKKYARMTQGEDGIDNPTLSVPCVGRNVPTGVALPRQPNPLGNDLRRVADKIILPLVIQHKAQLTQISLKERLRDRLEAGSSEDVGESDHPSLLVLFFQVAFVDIRNDVIHPYTCIWAICNACRHSKGNLLSKIHPPDPVTHHMLSSQQRSYELH